MNLHGARELPSSSGLNALLDTAAANSPEHVLIEDDAGAWSAAAVARRTRRLAAELRRYGLARGERVLVVAGAQAMTLVATAAALRIGIEPVLAPCHAGPVELAGFAQACGAAALIGPTRCGTLDLGDTYLAAAAAAENIRGILTHGPGRVDGAADISPAVLDAAEADAAGEAALLEMPTIATFAGAVPVSHRQASLFADALSLVEQAQIDPSKRVLALLPPATRAGLVGGPFAALVGAAGLVLHGPFDARRFLQHCDAAPGAHILVPAAAGTRIADAAPTSSSLILVSRFADVDGFALPDALTAGAPVVDLYAFGEDAVLAQARHGGEADWPRRAAGLGAADGLGAQLNRARAENRMHGADPR